MKNSGRKIRFAYFVAMLLTLGFVSTLFSVVLSAVYGTFAGSLLALAAGVFASNVAQKKLLEASYMKQLELSNGDESKQ